MVHSVTKHIFSGPDHQGALLTRRRPGPPIGYGEARDYLISQYGNLPEGRAREEFGSTLADYINTEISARAETCHDNVHYKAIDNGRWYILGRYVEPAPGQYPSLPADNPTGRNQVGNIYEALVGLYWLEGKYQDLVDLFLTLMDLDQIEYAGWTAGDRRTSTGFLRGAAALRCSDFVFTYFGREFQYRNGGPSPAPGAVAEPRLPSIKAPEKGLRRRRGRH